jgi:hypothetical protein
VRRLRRQRQRLRRAGAAHQYPASALLAAWRILTGSNACAGQREGFSGVGAPRRTGRQGWPPAAAAAAVKQAGRGAAGSRQRRTRNPSSGRVGGSDTTERVAPPTLGCVAHLTGTSQRFPERLQWGWGARMGLQPWLSELRLRPRLPARAPSTQSQSLKWVLCLGHSIRKGRVLGAPPDHSLSPTPARRRRGASRTSCVMLEDGQGWWRQAMQQPLNTWLLLLWCTYDWCCRGTTTHRQMLPVVAVAVGGRSGGPAALAPRG